MLSKAIKPNKLLVNMVMVSCLTPALTTYILQRRAFGTNPGIFHRVFNTLDKNTLAYKVARHDPVEPLSVSGSDTH